MATTVYCNFNGAIAETAPQFYGEVAFTTFRAFGPLIPWWDRHLERLKCGADYLDSTHNWGTLLKELEEGQVQFTKYFQDREWMGRPTLRYIDRKIQLNFYAWEAPIFNDVPQKLAFALEERTRHLPTHVKGGDYLIENRAREWAISQGMDDVLFWHGPQKYLSETSTSNVFFINEQKEITTPSLEEGSCLAGIARQNLITMAKGLGLQIFERPIKQIDLDRMTEVFLTNCGQLIRPVEQVGNYFFSSSQHNSLTNTLKRELNFMYRMYGMPI